MGERTFVLLKPDAVQRALVGEILGRFERRGLKVVAMRMLRVTRSLGETYYAEHKGKPFFEPLMSYISSGPVVAMVLEGDGAVASVRRMMGKTNSAEAEPGTIRGDLALTIGRNVIHGSDSAESAKREISLFFKADEIQAYARIDEAWLRECDRHTTIWSWNIWFWNSPAVPGFHHRRDADVCPARSRAPPLERTRSRRRRPSIGGRVR